MSNSPTTEGHLSKIKPGCVEDPIYISGPMSGVLEQNYPLFNKVAVWLRSLDLLVYNPAENFGGMLGLPREEYMRQDMAHVLSCRSILMLPGWEGSSGALLEVAIARELHLPVWRYLPDSPRFEEVGEDGHEFA